MTAGDIRQRVLDLQQDRKPVPLDFAPWGEGIYIRVLSANDQAAMAALDGDRTMPVRIILACLVDADGERIFAEDDADTLGEFPFPEIMQVFTKVARLNGLTSDELEEAVASFATAPDEQRSTG